MHLSLIRWLEAYNPPPHGDWRVAGLSVISGDTVLALAAWGVRPRTNRIKKAPEWFPCWPPACSQALWQPEQCRGGAVRRRPALLWPSLNARTSHRTSGGDKRVVRSYGPWPPRPWH